MKLLKAMVNRIIQILKYVKFEKRGVRYRLIDVKSINGSLEVDLYVIIHGIKKQILIFKPEEIVFDDILLSEFSAKDVRIITYLSFQKYLSSIEGDLRIQKQYIENGKTFFLLNTQEGIMEKMSAKDLYQNYSILTKLSKHDMINVISTAVQEQTFLDMHQMESKYAC